MSGWFCLCLVVVFWFVGFVGGVQYSALHGIGVVDDSYSPPCFVTMDFSNSQINSFLLKQVYESTYVFEYSVLNKDRVFFNQQIVNCGFDVNGIACVDKPIPKMRVHSGKVCYDSNNLIVDCGGGAR